MELLDADPVELGGRPTDVDAGTPLGRVFVLLKRSADEATLRKAFPVLNKLESWFSQGTALVKAGYDTVERAAGKQLLETLVAAMSSTGAVLTHVPQVLAPLREATKDEAWYVRPGSSQGPRQAPAF